MIFYIGPGAGFVFVGTFAALLAALFSGFLSLFLWPIRLLRRAMRGTRAYRGAKVKRVIFLGLDGLDPNLVERYMSEGKLPNFSRIAQQGRYRRLRTTFPCLSPVAWSCFATGGNPAKHAIFDFLGRSLKTYAPELSSSRVRPPLRTLRIGKFAIPLGKPVVEMRRKSVPFWKLLGDHDIHSTILRVPITFPPDRFNGHMLSAMCTPDLRGTQGSFTFYSTGIEASGTSEGMRLPLRRLENGVLEGEFLGPPDGDSPKGAMTVPFRLREVDKDVWQLEVQNQRYRLTIGEYSDWISVRFKKGFLGSAKGIARVHINRVDPHFEMYMSPINIDPGAPALPISHPASYAIYLSKLLGSYATLGLAEDTWALNERVIDEDTFLKQAYLNHEEREKMFFNALENTPRGVVACVFDASDRIQHMFFRCFEPDHPANRDREVDRYGRVIEELYIKMDDLLGRTLKHVDDKTLFFALSDHGFASFQRGINLNSWLRDNGYLVLKDGATESPDFFQNVDWDRTRAYAVGLGGLYINRKGREDRGIVQPGKEARDLKEEIAAKLCNLKDPDRGTQPIVKVEISDKVYRGPYLDGGPDLLVGYNRGYRLSWAAATGGVSAEVFEDNDKAWGGDHCIDPDLVPGVLFCNRDITVDDPGLEDLAPTTLSMFSVPVPGHMDGRCVV